VGQQGRVIIDGRGATNVRQTPGGTLLTSMSEGTTFSVIDGPFCLQADSGNAVRWYQIQLANGTVGWSPEASNNTYALEPWSGDTSTVIIPMADVELLRESWMLPGDDASIFATLALTYQAEGNGYILRTVTAQYEPITAFICSVNASVTLHSDSEQTWRTDFVAGPHFLGLSEGGRLDISPMVLVNSGDQVELWVVWQCVSPNDLTESDSYGVQEVQDYIEQYGAGYDSEAHSIVMP